MAVPGLAALGQFAAALNAAQRRFRLAGGFILSSHVAMSLMLSLFPFILFVAALAGGLSRDLDSAALIELLFGLWPEAVARPIEAELSKVLEASHIRLMTLGGVLTLYFASNGVDAIRLAIGQAYRESDPRPYWRIRAMCLVFVLVGGAALLLVLTLGVALPALSVYANEYLPAPLLRLGQSPAVNAVIPALVTGLAVLSCHIWLPGTRHGFRDIWPGVLVTLVLWGGAVSGFAYYLGTFADYAATYAGLAGVMAALIFLYLIAAILIFGAEVNGALMMQRRRP